MFFFLLLKREEEEVQEVLCRARTHNLRICIHWARSHLRYYGIAIMTNVNLSSP